jgi:hypothetical protein
MTTQAAKEAIDRFILLYGEPRADRPEAYLIEYAKVLSGYDQDVMLKAVDLVIRRHKFRTWPTLGEVCEACAEVSPSNSATAAETMFPGKGVSRRGPYDPVTLERWRLAKEWQDGIVAEFGSMETYWNKTKGRERISQFRSVAKPAFEAMQAASPNRHLYRAGD